MRKHDTYKQDHWTVLDMEHVDKVFVANSETNGTPVVRIDMDGSIAPSTMNDVGEEGDNVQTSAWVPLPEAVELKHTLENAIDAARSER
ncbi:hypothetical protein SAMN05421809_3751 [Natronorubrum daqingense]|nr:hypothetical protein SAMN05421809_3751 [Natronorubrum daqingense]